MYNENTHTTYGYSWMLHAVEEQTAADYAKVGTRDELKLYLDVKLEKTNDVIGWWGVSIPVLP